MTTLPIRVNMPPLPATPLAPLRVPRVMPALPATPLRIPANFPALPALPAHARPVHPQPGNAQPGNAQPGNAQPADAQPVHQQPGNAQPVHTQPVHARPGHVQPADVQPGNVQPADPQAQQPQPAVPTLAKTKRRSMKLLNGEPDAVRYAANADATKAALETIYDAYYDGGSWRGGQAQLNTLYRLMGYGQAGYLTTAVTDKDLQSLVDQPNSRVTAQKWSEKQKADTKYAHDLAAYNANPQGKQRPKKPTGPNSNAEALAIGDYFHIHNLNHQPHPESQRVRRIIVNVKTQQSGLKVAKKLGTLIQDPDVNPYLREYKIYLSKAANPNQAVKHDKLVVYYETRKGGEDSPDSVGDKIAATIDSAVTKAERGTDFAPFYSRVGTGIAWAEEPKYFVQSLPGSFTTTRSEIIGKVIKDNKNIASKEDFITKVNQALTAAKVDPVSAHRHLVPVPTTQGGST